MERALTEPGLGYYAASDLRPTRQGDFLTAPELHPVFARCIARALIGVWRRLEEPDRFSVEEHGAGRGTLRDQTIAALRAEDPRVAQALRWRATDLDGRGDGPAEEDPLVGIVLANEYLDALPVHRVVGSEGGLLERYVTWADGWFAFVDGPLSSRRLAEHLRAGGVPTLAPGHVADVSLRAPEWLIGVAARLERGVILVIDYGHPAAELYGPSRPAGTLLAYRGHRVSDELLDAVGRQDLTAHVDLTALTQAADRAGLRLEGSTTQARFLVSLGLGGILSELGRDAMIDASAYLEARASVARLLDPRHLGAFRVLAWSRGLAEGEPLAGFGA